MSQVDTLNIAAESFGPDDAPAVLLVHGLGMPLSGWPQALIDSLLAGGFRVLMFDNRDIGRST
ncbi:MAG: alpha/beta hydrolase, partial [Woeseia sp.]|nr:alpha/beta hydrolase [Woeseia sp.]